MSDTIDLRLLGKMVSRLQSTIEDVRQEYAGIRASLDSLNTRNAEFNLRMSSLELAQMRLAASVDSAHTKIDRIELEVENFKAATADRLDGMASQQETMNATLDLILTRLGER